MIKVMQYGPVTRYDLARTLGGRGRYWTTCYRIDGMMIDTGCAHTARELSRELASQPLTLITNTHTHEDHIGANGLLQRRQPDLPIRAHPRALPVLADPPRVQPLHPYRRLFWGWPEPSQAEPAAEGSLIETENYRFEVIYTPGHSPDHICIYEPDQGWLFSGDLYVGGKDRALRKNYDIWQIIASLKKIAALPFSVLFPGSARVPEEPLARLHSKIAYLEGLGEKVLDLHRQGIGIDEIANRLCGGPLYIEWVTLGHFTRRCLVLSYLHQNEEIS